MTDDELRALAQAATPGPWEFVPRWGPHEADGVDTADGTYSVIALCDDCGCERSEDAAYIAAVSPDRVLALLDALEAAKAERDEARQREAAAVEMIQAIVADGEADLVALRAFLAYYQETP